MTTVRRTALFAVILTLLTAAAACGSDDSLTLNGKPIANASEFLDQAEQAWRHDLADQTVNIGKHARCYYVVTPGEAEVKRAIFCGPARRPPLINSSKLPRSTHRSDGLIPHGGLWDALTFSAHDTASSALQLDQPILDSIGRAQPRTADLVRPDNQQPSKHASDLSLPAPPPARPGLVIVSQATHVKWTASTEKNLIVTPRVTIAVPRVGLAQSVVTKHGTRGPAPGERLIAAQLHFTKGPLESAYDPGSHYHPSRLVKAQPHYAFRVGNDRTEISFDDSASTQTVVASVPKPSKPELVVTVDGVEQGLSLTTGKRISETAAAFYQDGNEASLARDYPRSHASTGDFDLTHSIRFTDARLAAFHPTLGWPDKGKSWLIINTDKRAYRWDGLYSITVEQAETASVVDEAGQTSYSVVPSHEQASFIPSELIQLVFQVDSDQRSFEVTYQPTIEFSAQGAGPDPGEGSVRLRSMTFNVNFSSD